MLAGPPYAHRFPYLMYRPTQPLAGYQGLGALGFSSTARGTAKGASTGASIGSAVPVIGTAVGAILGGAVGAIASVLGKKDAEIANFDDAIRVWKANPDAVYSIPNKYLALAGLFDLKLHSNVNIPIYRKYGRMGEQRFVNDMIMLIYNAAQSGQITTSDTPQSIFSRIVQPWIDSFGFGPMSDPNADMIQRLLLGMVMDYIVGNQRNWVARGGDYVFGNLPAFSLPQAAMTPQVIAATPPPPPPVPYQAAPVPTPIYQAPPMPVASVPGPVLQVQPLPAIAQMRTPATPAIDQTALIQQLLAQGASQQQAYLAALQNMQAQGQPITPQVQQQVASEVQTHAATAGFSGGGWIAGGLAIVAILFATARPMRRR